MNNGYEHKIKLEQAACLCSPSHGGLLGDFAIDMTASVYARLYFKTCLHYYSKILMQAAPLQVWRKLYTVTTRQHALQAMLCCRR